MATNAASYDKYLDFLCDRSGGFMQALFEAMSHADGDNLERLRKGFPGEVEAWETWNRVGGQVFLSRCSNGNPLVKVAQEVYDL